MCIVHIEKQKRIYLFCLSLSHSLSLSPSPYTHTDTANFLTFTNIIDTVFEIDDGAFQKGNTENTHSSLLVSIRRITERKRERESRDFPKFSSKSPIQSIHHVYVVKFNQYYIQ
jgi:hypothetical protein